MHVVSLLQQELRHFARGLLQGGKNVEEEAAQLRCLLARAEAVAKNFPAEGTETFPEHR